MTQPSSEALLAAIAHVQDPAFEKPLVELGLVSNARVEEGVAHLTVRLAAPSASGKAKVEGALREALIPALATDVAIEWDLHVPMRALTAEDPVPGVRNVLLVMSGKGGVGKSTTAANLALALKRQGARVGLLDADIYGPSMPTMFGLEGHPSSPDGVRIEPLERFGIKVMSIGFLMDDPKSAIVWRGPMLHGALKQFLKDVNWGTLDYLVLDLPPGTGDVALTLAQAVKVSGVVMVTTPQEVALQDVYKSVSMCEKLSLPILGVVETMSYFIDPAGVRHELFGAGGGRKIADFAKAPLLGQIPMETAVREWGDKGTPIVQASPDAASSRAYMHVADELTTRIAIDAFQRSGGTKAPPSSGPTRLKILR